MIVELADDAATLALGARLAAALPSPGERQAPQATSVSQPRAGSSRTSEFASSAFPAQGLQLNLSGRLGAGKTTVVRGLLRAMGETGTVRSPTYTLIEPYELRGWQVMHYDLYRIAGAEELELLGVREHFCAGVLRCVEWPERAGADWANADLTLELRYESDHREALLRADGEHGERWLARLKCA